MTFIPKRAAVAAAIATVIAGAACRNQQPADDGLKADLDAAVGHAGSSSGAIELAPSASRSQTVVSAIEGGPSAAPARASAQRTPQPMRRAASRPTTHVAQLQTRIEAPRRAQQEAVTDAPAAEPTVAPTPAPAPRPAPVQQQPRQDGRVYKTEAEIFRQMPWIRP